MTLATTYCRATVGVSAPLVVIETHLANGLPAFNIVGLAEKAVQESKERVRSALANCGFEFPARRITVALGPADLPKHGGRYDLAIAIGILAASEQLPHQRLEQYEFAAELTLSGQLKPIQGILPLALSTRNANRHLVIAPENIDEAMLVENLKAYAPDHLLAICKHLAELEKLSLGKAVARDAVHLQQLPDMADVKGQAQAKRALEIAAAGQHNMLMIGPPGSGKSMLASRLPSILPELNEDQAIESAAIYSIAGQPLDQHNWRQRKIRQPHHTSSGVALVGGGSTPKPGEISLAHNQILFLDEVVEFNPKVLEVLREPLETGQISISRANAKIDFPARFQLIAAMNPCRCGYANDPERHCGSCSAIQIQRYQGRLSGPLRDRIDIQIEVPAMSSQELLANNARKEIPSSEIKQRVMLAHAFQQQRQACSNAHLSHKQLENVCQLSSTDQVLLSKAIDQLKLSARAYHRILRVARTIADLDDSAEIATRHLTEAIGYRRFDQQR